MRTMLPRRRRTLRLPSHFWYLVERVAYMLSVVRVDADRRRGILAVNSQFDSQLEFEQRGDELSQPSSGSEWSEASRMWPHILTPSYHRSSLHRKFS